MNKLNIIGLYSIDYSLLYKFICILSVLLMFFWYLLVYYWYIYVNDIVLIIILINKWYGYLNYNKFILIIKFMVKCKYFMWLVFEDL